MRKALPRLSTAVLLPLSFSLVASASIRPHHHGSTHATLRHNVSTHTSHHAAVEHVATPSMSSERATEIQTALIQRGYLSGEASGTWDSASRDAMQKLQSDNGWQTKLVPDSRALIKLGLGPNNAGNSTAQIATPSAALAEAPSLN